MGFFFLIDGNSKFGSQRTFLLGMWKVFIQKKGRKKSLFSSLKNKKEDLNQRKINYNDEFCYWDILNFKMYLNLAGMVISSNLI